MNFAHKKIGIWGLGIVGKAAVQFFQNHNAHIELVSLKEPSNEDLLFLQTYAITMRPYNELPFFLDENELILVSPGIDTALFKQYHEKFITEADIFDHFVATPLIGITGSVGKTTVTHLLSHCLAQSGLTVTTGGNIGIGALSLITQAQKADVAVLELSSFQLEQCRSFAPDLAIITNLYPNHLDRHQTMDHYYQAKSGIFKHQHPGQRLLAPLSLAPYISKKPLSDCYFFSIGTSPSAQLPAFAKGVFYYTHQQIILITDTCSTVIAELSSLEKYEIFAENMLIIAAALYLYGRSTDVLSSIPKAVALEHRLEKVATVNGVEYYNDSKSTVPQATLAAAQQLASRPLIILLGGQDKGVNREPLIQQLALLVQSSICFGKQASQLADLCKLHNIPTIACATLEEAVSIAQSTAAPGDIVLLSPSGSSFDLFTNFQERGKRFKALVLNRN